MLILKEFLVIFLIYCSVVCAGNEAHFVSDSITPLTTTNFDTFVKDNKYVLVTFFAPWCGHCSALEPELKSLCTELTEKSSSVKCGSVDATENMELAQQFGVSGYPTIKLFSGLDSSQNYSGARTKDQFAKWISKLTGPAVQVTEKFEEAIALADSLETAFIARLPNKDSHLFKDFEIVANKNREHNFPFIVVLNDASNKLVIYHKDEEQVVIDFPKTLEQLETTVSQHNVPLLAPISGDNYAIYMSRSGYTVWFCSTTEDYQKYGTIIREVAAQFREKYAFVFLDTDQYGAQLSQHLLIDKFPGMVVQSVKVAAMRYLYDKNIFNETEPIIEFINAIEAGTYPLNIKSEETPAEQAGPVTVVVGNTFEELVFQKEKDVLLEIYAPWCGHCKNLEPIYNQLAEELKSNDKVLIAKINGPANDIPFDGFTPKAFPTILFVRAGSKVPIQYDGKRTVEAMKEFIEEHSLDGAKSAKHDEL